MARLKGIRRNIVSNATLEEEHAKAQALFESLGQGAITTDENGKIKQVNQQALDILGFKEKDLLGEWYPKVIIAQDEAGKLVQNIGRPITQAILGGKPVSTTTFYKRKNGSFVPVALTVSPIMLKGNPIGAVEVFRDYTQEYELDQMKSQFISLASHQLRTPLTSIMLNSHMLNDGYGGKLKPEQQKILDSVLISTDRMTELVTMLLNITRVEAGRVNVSPKPTDFHELAKQILKEQEPKAKEKSIRLIDLTSGKLPQVNTDQSMLREIYANLLSNAVKYTPPHGKVELDIEVKDKEIVSTIADNGYGIPKKEQRRVFQKFYRGENIMKKEAIGTGLGLYLIKMLAETLGGKMWFTSTEGKGTTFSFSIPLSGSEARVGTTILENTKPAV